MHPLLNTAIAAARAAGSVIVRHIDRIDRLTISSKSRNDFVSEVDHMAEREILQRLHRAYPDHAILAEESGILQGKSEFKWIIDPLDGTTNFLFGIPHYAVSIGLMQNGRMQHAVIYDPVKDELFTASHGGGAQLNNTRIRVNQRTSLEGTLLATGIPFREGSTMAQFMPTLEVLVKDTAGIRRAGSAALDLAYVAAGRFDGYWEFALKPWDIAAGTLIVQEAGGLVGDLRGEDKYLENGDILCGSPKVYEAMKNRLASVLPERQA